MTLKQHYKQNIKLNIWSCFFILFITVILIYKCYTLSRYSETTSNPSVIDLAQWIIYINDERVSNDTTDLTGEAKIIPDDNNKTALGAGDTGYFDIEIDPSGTEVSLEYSINIDLSKLPSGTVITSCDLTANSTTEQLFTGNINTIEDSFTLNNGQALSNSDVRRYRVHCKIDDNAVITAEDTFYVTVTVDGQQII